MKSRLSVILALALGMMLSTAGAGLAVSGFTSDDASVAQYGPDTDVGGEGDVLPEQEVRDGDEGDVAGETDESLQPTRQAEAGVQEQGDELPFTGFAAIPILIGGVALLSTGLVLRRRSGDDERS